MWSLATDLLVSSAVSTGVGVYGKISAGNAAAKVGQAQQAAADSQATLDDYNASVAAAQARDAIAQGDIAADKLGQQVKGMIGAQRTGYAAGNVDVGYGSSVDVQADTARQGALDQAQIRSNAARQAWGYNVQSYNETQAASIARQTGVMEAEAGSVNQETDYLGAAQTGLIGGTSILKSYYGMGAG